LHVTLCRPLVLAFPSSTDFNFIVDSNFSFCPSLIRSILNPTSASTNCLSINQSSQYHPNTSMRANHNINRKRAAAANDETPPPKRHHPYAVERLLETVKFQQQQIEMATEIWVRLKGGENRLGDANAMFLGLIKSAMYSESLAVKLVETQDVNDDDDDDDDDELE
jgi:hypothetical protein